MDAFDQFPDAPAGTAGRAADPFDQFPDAAPAAPAPSAPAAPVQVDAPAPPPQKPALAGDSLGGLAKMLPQGVVTGLEMLMDGPVNIVNQSPRLLNINGGLINKIMGREVVPSLGPISDNPLLPSDIIQAPGRALGVKKYEAQGPLERIVDRVGQELGASALPVVGSVAAGARIGAAGARQMMTGDSVAQRILGPMVEAGAVNPAGVVGRETSGAVAAGLGAGAAVEAVTPISDGAGARSSADFAGSVAGNTALALARPILGGIGSLAGAAAGSSKFADDVARSEVANDLLANSTTAQRQVQAGVDRGMIDAQPLADQLRRPAEVEQVIPGYQADIADRSGDPGLAAYVYGKTAARPGLDTGRRVANQQVVNERVDGLAPTGNAGQFREDLQGGVDRRLSDAELQAETAQRALQEQLQSLTATMTGEARGADIRAALQRAAEEARAGVRQAYEPINNSAQQIDVKPLADRFGALDEGLSVAERQRFRPAEADIPRRLIGPAEAAGPVDTGLLDASGKPITREPRPGNSQQPINEVTGLRASLTDDARAARSANRPAEARIIDQHVTALDNYFDEAIPEGLRGQLDTARSARRDVADRFERPGRAVAEVLKERQGVPTVKDSGVAPRFAQPDEGNLSDLRDLMREAGGDAGVRPALRDQFLANVRDRGLLDRPEQLNAYLDRHATLLDQLPGLRDEIAAGGTASRGAAEARTAADTTRRELTTPGRSPEASYLKYDNTGTVESMRTVLKDPRPEQAADRLLATSGTDPQNARAAFWEVLRKEATNQGGVNDRAQINGLAGSKFLSDPRNKAVAERLYRDNPEQLKDITDVFDALAGSGAATRARRPGSSGTAQGMNAGYDASLSASSITSRIRSINRGQLSPTVAGVDLLATYLRRKSAGLQKGAIERLQDEVIQNPQLAAKLLEDYNPANFAAQRRELLTVGGVRATETLRLFDAANDEEQRPEAAAVRRAGER